MTIDEMIEVLQAAKAGKRIERRTVGTQDDWMETLPSWNFNSFEYRVKPEPRWFRLIRRGNGWEVDTPDYRNYKTQCESISVVEVI